MKKITTVVMAVAMFCLVSFNNAQAQDVATEFKPSGKVTGQVFADYQVKVHADSALRGSTQYAKVPTHFNSFEFRRIYLGYEYNFSEQFSAVVNLAQEGSNFDASGNRTFYPKQAFVNFKNSCYAKKNEETEIHHGVHEACCAVAQQRAHVDTCAVVS